MLRLLLLAITTTRASAFISPYAKRTAVTRMSAKKSLDEARDIVIIGGGIQGTSVAFQLHESSALPKGSTITILESQKLASAASGKGGGFMARSWGSGPTVALHELAFDMYESLCPELGVESYRKLPVMSVAPGPTNNKAQDNKKKNPQLADIVPNWLDGSVGRLSPMGWGDDSAQESLLCCFFVAYTAYKTHVTPKEFVEKMLAYVNKEDKKPGISVVIGKCVGIQSSQDGDKQVVTGVKYQNNNGEEEILPCTDCVVANGPWACQAEEWFNNAVQIPMEGIKSTSIVWKPPVDEDGNAKISAVEATALFCGEDDRYSTHLEVYPRPDGTVYICGIGGSDYITTPELKASAYLEECLPKDDRVKAASSAFKMMSKTYAKEGELLTKQACMRPCPPDAKPYMGTIRGWKGAYINAGHNCWGIAWAPATGKAISELILEGHSKSINLKAFDPARFTTGGRGGRGRKKGSVDVGEQW